MELAAVGNGMQWAWDPNERLERGDDFSALGGLVDAFDCAV